MAHTFRVWAPAAGRVELELTDHARVLPMAGGDDGWWSLEVADAGPGTRYLFRLDGDPGRPDPRSPWQPEGVHGPSGVVDHGAYPWHDDGWSAPPLSEAVIYELHVGTFSPAGTFLGAIDHLDELVELGVTHLELMPVAAFAGEWGWGYDGVDLWSPHPAYGTPDDLKALVDAAHGRGLAVLLDVVYNHLGPDGNHLGAFGPYFTDRYGTPWGEAVNVDGPGSTEVRRFIVDNALMWLRDHHLDGLRLDAVHAIIDTGAVHLLEQLSAAVAELAQETGRRLTLIAESDRNDPRLLTPRDEGGLGIDAHWNDDFHHAVHVALTGEQDSYYVDYEGLEHLADALRHAWVYRGQYSEFRERHHGRPAEGMEGHRFVGYVQNHDQVGNRARGERLSHLLDPHRLEVAAALVATAPFVPMLFQGQEWGATAPFPYFADHRHHPELADAVRTGRLEEFASFGWSPDEVTDPEDPATFRSAVLDRTEIAREPHATLRRWYHDLLALRAREPALRDGDLDRIAVHHDPDLRTLSYRRGDLAVAVNLGPQRDAVALPDGPAPVEILLGTDPGAELLAGAVVLGPDRVAVVRTG